MVERPDLLAKVKIGYRGSTHQYDTNQYRSETIMKASQHVDQIKVKKARHTQSPLCPLLRGVCLYDAVEKG